MTGAEQIFMAIGAIVVGLAVVGGVIYLRRKPKAQGSGNRGQKTDEKKK